MTWRKYFTPVSISDESGSFSPIHGKGVTKAGPARTNYSSFLPEIYTGAPNRIERYLQYATMDMDSEVNAALDILAEFCTQRNKENRTPFTIFFKNKATNSETSILREYLQQWSKLQEFDTRIFRIFRNVLKNGDCFFIRDPETQKWYYIDPTKLIKIIVNESDGKAPEQYIIRDLAPNFQNLVVTQINPGTNNINNRGTSYVAGGAAARGMIGAYPANPSSSSSRFSLGQDEAPIEARHVVHLSLSEGLDNNYPFGNSILETVFKVYKQKELLEDAVLIYRITRAPERRVFYIDVGNMPPHLAMSFVERFKNEISQRRIPSSTGGQSGMSKNVIDSAFNPMCLDLATRIPLLDGRTLALSELIDEYQTGKENWVYSCNPETGNVVPGNITWAGITRKNTETIKITLDNGKELICTPDHKVPVLGKGFVEAQHLVETDSLISFNTRYTKMGRAKKANDYQDVWDHEHKKWIRTHQMVGYFMLKQNKHQQFTYLEENAAKHKNVIHHWNENRFDNTPVNLFFMDKHDHIKYHSDHKKEYWENMSIEERDRITSKISNTLKENWKLKSAEEKQNYLEWFASIQRKSVEFRKNDPIVKEKYRCSMSASRKNYFTKNPAELEKFLASAEGKRVHWKNQELNMTFEMLQHLAEAVKNGAVMKKDAIKVCSKNQALLDIVKRENSFMTEGVTQNKIDFNSFGEKKVNRLLSKFGYKDWRTFVNEIENFNHKIVKIEKWDSMDVGTLTIDGKEEYHNFHTFAIDSGIFVKNSTNEDFYIPTGENGKGSKVETLAGGSAVGEVTDLKFFTNKLFRALRIPSSYLPTGDDDSVTPHSDGRVGTAYIQELRFNNYCMRLQSLIQEIFDQEFKLYLYNRGVNIDTSLFDLKFQEPQNFASYRQAEMDNARIGTFGQLVNMPIISKRFALKRFLGLSEEEIAENERLWAEENGETSPTATDSSGEMRGVGISQAGIQSDMQMGMGMGMEPPPGQPGMEQSPEGAGMGAEGEAGMGGGAAPAMPMGGPQG